MLLSDVLVVPECKKSIAVLDLVVFGVQAERLREILTRLGPAFVKIGQVSWL